MYTMSDFAKDMCVYVSLYVCMQQLTQMSCLGEVRVDVTYMQGMVRFGLISHCFKPVCRRDGQIRSHGDAKRVRGTLYSTEDPAVSHSHASSTRCGQVVVQESGDGQSHRKDSGSTRRWVKDKIFRVVTDNISR